MKKILVGITLLTSLSGLASECIVSSVSYGDYSSKKVANARELIETELLKNGYIIDPTSDEGLHVSVETGRAMNRDGVMVNGPSIKDFSSEVGHFITADLFRDSLEAHVRVVGKDGAKSIFSFGNKYSEVDDLVVDALAKMDECL